LNKNNRYTIVLADSAEGLVEKVNQRIDEGWELIGGHCAFPNGTVIMFSQSMVFRQKIPIKKMI